MKSKRQKIILSTNCKDAKENIRKWMRQSLENTVIKRDDLDCRERVHFNLDDVLNFLRGFKTIHHRNLHNISGSNFKKSSDGVCKLSFLYFLHFSFQMPISDRRCNKRWVEEVRKYILYSECRKLNNIFCRSQKDSAC